MNDFSQFKLGRAPDVFVQDIEARSARLHLVQLTEDQYRHASFLDQRILTGGIPAQWADWHVVATAANGLPPMPGPDYIFHIGHVGSTLLARILGDHPGVFALREPPWLRTLAAASAEGSLAGALPSPITPVSAVQTLSKFTARTFRPGQKALVKATSFASELAPLLLPASPNAKTIGITTSPQSHMATLIAGANNMTEVQHLGPSRLARLKRRVPAFDVSWSTLTTGERLAATWLAEMTSISQALSIAGPSAMALDFEVLLKDPPLALHTVLVHLHGQADPKVVASLAASAHFSRYSKEQSFEYSPQLRVDMLTQAWRTHADALRGGMHWLNAKVRAHPEINRMLGPFLG